MFISSINLGSFNTSKTLLEYYTISKKIDIAYVSESFEHNDNLKMYGWKIYSKPRPTRIDKKNPHGAVAIFARVSTKTRIPKDMGCPDIEMIYCETADNTKFPLVCVYILTDKAMSKLCNWMENLDHQK